MKRTITVSSRALGPRLKVTCYIYDTLDEMRAAAEAYNGASAEGCLGVTQCRTDGDSRAVAC